MKIRLISLLMLCALFLTGCGGQEAQQVKEEASWQNAQELYDAIAEQVELPEMVNVVGDYLEANTGITEESYDSAVYYLLKEGTAPDELVILFAKDEAAAADICQRLENYLEYKEKSVQLYLTEYLPLIETGIISRNGLVVSMVISEQAEEISAICSGNGEA